MTHKEAIEERFTIALHELMEAYGSVPDKDTPYKLTFFAKRTANGMEFADMSLGKDAEEVSPAYSLARLGFPLQ